MSKYLSAHAFMHSHDSILQIGIVPSTIATSLLYRLNVLITSPIYALMYIIVSTLHLHYQESKLI